MLTTARPIFENVSASFMDPVSLADQQAQGVVSLIVVRYGADGGPEGTGSGPVASGESHGTLGPGTALGPIYDAFVAASGQLLAVARTTTDYRYPVMPATALSRFIEHRDAGLPVALSMYELAEDDCARFLETVFYSECLKLHVDGAASAQLVARQIACSGCGNGVLEVNDFSDAAAPRVRLIDLDGLVVSIGTVPPSAGGDPAVDPGTVDPGSRADIGSLAAVLAGHLDGVRGRVLLYDRAKNKATLPDRSSGAFDLDGIIEQANRLAEARRGGGGDAAAIAMQRTAADPSGRRSQLRATVPDERADAVEDYLREQADRPRIVDPSHPHATGLGALVAELQGGRATSPTAGTGAAPTGPLASLALGPTGDLALGVLGDPPTATAPDGDSQAGEVTRPPAPTEGDGQAGPVPVSSPAIPTPVAPEAPMPTQAPTAPAPSPATLPSPLTGTERHVLATELDRLRTDVFELFESAVGRERAVAHEAHVLDEHGIASPVAAEHTVRYLRALLCDEPPKRWHFFKRSRTKTYEEVAGKLLAFHAANGHVDSPVVHEVTKLWTRLHK